MSADDIKPALTAEEWRRETIDDPTKGAAAAIFLDRSPEGIVHLVVRSHDTWRGEPYTGAWRMYGSRPAAIMALANAAMPDDHPNKLTREDVVALRSAAHFLEEQRGGRLSTVWPDDANPWRDLAPKLRDAAARLAALLPPEEGQ